MMILLWRSRGICPGKLSFAHKTPSDIARVDNIDLENYQNNKILSLCILIFLNGSSLEQFSR